MEKCSFIYLFYFGLGWEFDKIYAMLYVKKKIGDTGTDMQKLPSSLAVLAEIFLALAEIFKKSTPFCKDTAEKQRKLTLK